MKRSALIELYTPGIVLFDPVRLSGFISDERIRETNIFEAFLEDELLGRKAINQGVVCPIYQISEREYSVFLMTQDDELANLPEPIFVYPGFPLAITSDVLIVSDLNALLDWDADFFLDYRAQYDSRLPSNDHIDVEPGMYSLTIRGYAALREQPSKLGYGLELVRVQALPEISDGASIDDLDFELEGR